MLKLKLDILMGTNLNEDLNKIRGFIQIWMAYLNYKFNFWSNINLKWINDNINFPKNIVASFE